MMVTSLAMGLPPRSVSSDRLRILTTCRTTRHDCAVVISGMLYAQVQHCGLFCHNLDGPFWVAVCITLLSAQGGYRDKTLNGR